MSFKQTADMTRPWEHERSRGTTRTRVYVDGETRLVIRITTVSDDEGDREESEAWLDDGHGVTATITRPDTTDPERLAVALTDLAHRARAAMERDARRTGEYDPRPVAAHAWREPDGAWVQYDYSEPPARPEAWRFRARKAWDKAQDRFDPHARHRLV